MQGVRMKTSDEINVVVQEWRELEKVTNGLVAAHTILVLWRAIKHLDIYHQLSSEDQNIIKWACLLHDVRKMGLPLINGKDHVHPFKSAITTLEVFYRMGLIINSEHSLLTVQQLCRLLAESVQPAP